MDKECSLPKKLEGADPDIKTGVPAELRDPVGAARGSYSRHLHKASSTADCCR